MGRGPEKAPMPGLPFPWHLSVAAASHWPGDHSGPVSLRALLLPARPTLSLAWGGGRLAHKPCEREGSPLGSGLAVFIWRQRRNLTRQVCLLRGPGSWGSGSLGWGGGGGLLNPFGAKAKWFCLMGFWVLFLED